MGINIEEFDEFYYSEEFKNMIRSNRNYLLSLSNKVIIINKDWQYTNRYNFYRFLTHSEEFNIPQYMHWVIAYLNNISDPTQDITEFDYITIVDKSVIEKMVQLHNTKHE